MIDVDELRKTLAKLPEILTKVEHTWDIPVGTPTERATGGRIR